MFHLFVFHGYIMAFFCTKICLFKYKDVLLSPNFVKFDVHRLIGRGEMLKRQRVDTQMKHWYIYILATLLTTEMCSCSSDDDRLEVPESETAEVYVSVTLAMNKGGVTRASASPTDMEKGQSYDDAIEYGDVELYVFDEENKFVEKVAIFIAGPNVWQGSLSNISQEAVRDGDYFHVMALCNHKGVLKTDYTPTEGVTLDEFIRQLSFTGYTADFTRNLTKKDAQGADVSSSSAARIPMWGIKSIQFSPSGTMTDVGTIDILRALAKVRIALGGDAQTKKFSLNGASLNVANPNGYLAAQAYGSSQQAYLTETYSGRVGYATNWNYVENGTTNKEDFNGDNDQTDRQDGIIHPSIFPTASTISTGLDFSKVTENGKEYYVIYIPEYNHFQDGGEAVQTPATIELTITDEAGNPVMDSSGNNYKLHFADYSNGKSPNAPQWDIIRNDIYDYTITKIQGGLQVQLKVAEWAGYTHSSGVVM